MWVTNNRAAAIELKKIDREYARAKAAAAQLPLAAKVTALREARERRDAAYREVGRAA